MPGSQWVEAFPSLVSLCCCLVLPTLVLAAFEPKPITYGGGGRGSPAVLAISSTSPEQQCEPQLPWTPALGFTLVRVFPGQPRSGDFILPGTVKR